MYYTTHALERMNQHGISYQMVNNAIAFGNKIQEKQDTVIKWQRLIVIIDKMNRVVTVYYNTSHN